MNTLEIPLEGVFSFMGMGSQRPDKTTVAVTERLVSEARSMLTPVFQYILTESAAMFSVGEIIGRQLRGATCYAVFVASAGNDYLEWKRMVSERDDILEQFIADCIGSQVAESVADHMELELQEELDRLGLKRTARFSPGYCEWPLSEQKVLFSLFDEQKPCGVTLTDSCLMIPEKSVSGIIGIGSDVRYLPYSCGICDKSDCYKRQRR